MSSVAIVTPFYRAGVSPDETIALRHLKKFLGGYEWIAVIPEELDFPLAQFRVERFSASWFVSIASYNKLLLSECFYERFEKYEFILIYQLDCLVFRDALARWCETEWDYIGAPWLTNFATKAGPGIDLWKVGNGGFSLRRVSSFLRVLRSYDRRAAVRIYWEAIQGRFTGIRRWMRLPKLALRALPVARPLRYHLDHNIAMEDWFWGVEASSYLPGFKVAPVQEALSFAFEADPGSCFVRNEHVLPFGAHAWPRYDRKFWEPHLIMND